MILTAKLILATASLPDYKIKVGQVYTVKQGPHGPYIFTGDWWKLNKEQIDLQDLFVDELAVFEVVE